MSIRRASAPVHGLKTLAVDVDGTFEAVVAVFSNVDLGGDRIVPGAFAKSLARWAESGDPIPVIWSHQWDDPFNHIGEVVEAKEIYPGDETLPAPIRDLGGLWVKARLDMDEPKARQAWKLLKRRRTKEFSFAYDVMPSGERRASDGANDLVELDLIEVGPTLKGMNPATQLVDVKHQEDNMEPPDPDEPDGQAAGDADGQKAMVTLGGSMEQRQEAIMRALWQLDRQTLNGMANGGLYWPYLEATFDDRAVFLFEGWDDPAYEGRYWQFPVTIADDGGVTLGEPVEVTIQGVVSPKARRKELAAGARRDGHAHDHVKADGNPEEPTANGDDLTSRNGSAGTGEAQRVLVELDLLQL